MRQLQPPSRRGRVLVAMLRPRHRGEATFLSHWRHRGEAAFLYQRFGRIAAKPRSRQCTHPPAMASRRGRVLVSVGSAVAARPRSHVRTIRVLMFAPAERPCHRGEAAFFSWCHASRRSRVLLVVRQLRPPSRRGRVLVAMPPSHRGEAAFSSMSASIRHGIAARPRSCSSASLEASRQGRVLDVGCRGEAAFLFQLEEE